MKSVYLNDFIYKGRLSTLVLLRMEGGTNVGSTQVEVNTKMIAGEGLSMDLWAGRFRQKEKKTSNPQQFFFLLCITEFKLWNVPLLFLDGLKYKLILKGTGKNKRELTNE